MIGQKILINKLIRHELKIKIDKLVYIWEFYIW